MSENIKMAVNLGYLELPLDLMISIDEANKREYFLKPGARDLPSGKYHIEVTEASGLDFQTDGFVLKRGQEVRLTAKFVAKVLAEKVSSRRDHETPAVPKRSGRGLMATPP